MAEVGKLWVGLGRRQKGGKIGVGSDVAGVEVTARRASRINRRFHLSCKTCGVSLQVVGTEGLDVKGEAENEREKRDRCGGRKVKECAI